MYVYKYIYIYIYYETDMFKETLNENGLEFFHFISF